MANVGGVAPGAGGTGRSDFTDGDRDTGFNKERVAASRRRGNPALAILGETGFVRAQRFDPSTEAGQRAIVDHLVELKYRRPDMEALLKDGGPDAVYTLRRAHAVMLTATPEPEQPKLRDRLLDIARRDDGEETLRALIQHEAALLSLRGTSTREILDLAGKPDGAAALTAKAREIEGL